MEWKAEYETGEKHVDSQHQHLFQYVNTLHELVSTVQGGDPLDHKVAEDLLFGLDTYVTIHFAYEEMCMGMRRCPYAAINKEAHQKLSAFYADFREQSRRELTLEMLQTLEETLTNWLTNHICRVDVTLRDTKA